MGRLRVAVLISGRGSNLKALLDATRDPDFPAEIVLVLSNRPEAAGLDIARNSGTPTVVVDHRDHKGDRAAFDAAMDAELRRASVDLVCLAGFMRILTDAFVGGWEGRMINIHPSLLPAFKGLDTHARALAEGAVVHGCTAHFVSPALDDGPIILQAPVPILEGDDADTLAARVLVEEHRIYPEALRLVAEGLAVFKEGETPRKPAGDTLGNSLMESRSGL